MQETHREQGRNHPVASVGETRNRSAATVTKRKQKKALVSDAQRAIVRFLKQGLAMMLFELRHTAWALRKTAQRTTIQRAIVPFLPFLAEVTFIGGFRARWFMQAQAMFCAAIFISLALSGCLAAPDAKPLVEGDEGPEVFTHQWSDGPTCFEHDSDQRCWISHIPQTIDSEGSAPLLIDIHGYGSTMHIQRNHTGLTELADEVGAVILYPQGIHRDGDPSTGGGAPSWNQGTCCADAAMFDIDDSGFLSNLIDLAIEELPIDETRVYLTGWSNGCGMAQRLAIDVSEKIAAVACTSFYLLYDLQPDYVPTPVLEMHGFLDEHALYASSMRSVIYNPLMQEDSNSFTTGAVQNIARWAEHNGCEGSTPDINSPGILYSVTGYSNCEGGAEVQLITVHQGNHNLYLNDYGEPSAWPYYVPGNQGLYDTGQIMWDFLSRFSTQTESEISN